MCDIELFSESLDRCPEAKALSRGLVKHPDDAVDVGFAVFGKPRG